MQPGSRRGHRACFFRTSINCLVTRLVAIFGLAPQIWRQGNFAIGKNIFKVSPPGQFYPALAILPFGKHLHRKIFAKFNNFTNADFSAGAQKAFGFLRKKASPGRGSSVFQDQRQGREQQKFHLAATFALATQSCGEHSRIVGHQKRVFGKITWQIAKHGIAGRYKSIARQHHQPGIATIFRRMGSYEAIRQSEIVLRKIIIRQNFLQKTGQRTIAYSKMRGLFGLMAVV